MTPFAKSRRTLVAAATLLTACFAQNAAADDQFVQLTIRLGQSQIVLVNLQLFTDAAPLTVENFMKYCTADPSESPSYLDTIFHRSAPDFVVQGGGQKLINGALKHIEDYGTVDNEFGISNTRGTIAMAKVGGDPNSATSEWFVNIADNSHSYYSVQDTDENGNPLFTDHLDENENIVYQQKEDAHGNLVWEQKQDENGNLLWEPQRDENGNIIYEQSRDSNGDPIFDGNGNPAYDITKPVDDLTKPIDDLDKPVYDDTKPVKDPVMIDKDNGLDVQNGGFTVFGKVATDRSMTVFDYINSLTSVDTTPRPGNGYVTIIDIKVKDSLEEMLPNEAVLYWQWQSDSVWSSTTEQWLHEREDGMPHAFVSDKITAFATVKSTTAYLRLTEDFNVADIYAYGEGAIIFEGGYFINGQGKAEIIADATNCITGTVNPTIENNAGEKSTGAFYKNNTGRTSLLGLELSFEGGIHNNYGELIIQESIVNGGAISNEMRPVYQKNDDGEVIRDEHDNPVPVLDDDNNPVFSEHTISKGINLKNNTQVIFYDSTIDGDILIGTSGIVTFDGSTFTGAIARPTTSDNDINTIDIAKELHRSSTIQLATGAEINLTTDFTNCGLIQGNGVIRTTSNFTNDGMLRPGGSSIGAITLDAPAIDFGPESIIEIQLLKTGTHLDPDGKTVNDYGTDRIINANAADITIGGNIRLVIDSNYLAEHGNNEMTLDISQILSQDPGAGNITFDEAILNNEHIKLANNGYIITEYQANDNSIRFRTLDIYTPLGFAALTAMPVTESANATDATLSHLKSNREAKVPHRPKTLKDGYIEQTSQTPWGTATKRIKIDSIAPEEVAPIASSSTDGFYFNATGNFAKSSGIEDGNAIFNLKTYGATIGGDHALDENYTIGGTLGINSATATFHRNAGSADQEHVRLAAYGEWQPRDYFWVNGEIHFGYSKYDTERHNNNTDDDDHTAKSSTNGYDIGAAIYLGGKIPFNDLPEFIFFPFAGMEFTHATVDSFSENGTANAMPVRMNSISQDSLRLRLGGTIDWQALDFMTLSFTAAYAHELLDNTVDIAYGFVNHPTAAHQQLKSVATPKKFFELSPGIEFSLGTSSKLRFDYSYISDMNGQNAHRLNGTYTYKF